MKKLLLAVFACVALATPVRAEDNGQINELLFQATSGSFTFGSGRAIVDLNVGYNYQIAAGWQVGVLGNLNSDLQATGATWGLRAALTANIPMEWSIDEAIFVTANIGIADAGAGEDVAFGAALGKRFKIVEHVTWRPSFAIDKVGAGALDFKVWLLAFSAVW